MNRIDRLFGILIILQSKKYVAADDIADKFNISIRTVYRDIKALSEQGIPVSFEPHKGYFIVQGYFLPPVSFSSEEANALLLMESIVNGFADKSIKHHYANALNKVKGVLKTSQKESFELLHKNTLLQKPSCIQYDFEFLSDIQKSITSRKILEIRYKNNQEETSFRQVEPVGLIFYALNWHLIAWCHCRNDYRDFKVSRILELRITQDGFKVEAHMELQDYMKLLPVNY